MEIIPGLSYKLLPPLLFQLMLQVSVNILGA